MKDMFGVEVCVGDKIFTSEGLCEIVNTRHDVAVIVKRYRLGDIEGLEFCCQVEYSVKMTPEQLHQYKSLELIRELANA